MTIPAEILEQARRLQLRTRRRVDGHFAGQYLSVFKGSGVEFADVREYIAGDDIRSIDWNVSARSDRAFVKQHIEERNLTVMLAVDASGSTAFGSSGTSKRERATEIALALAVAALGNGDRVGLALFTNEVEHALAPRRGRNTSLSLATALLNFAPHDARTSLGNALVQIDRLCRHRSLVFLVSDFIDDDDFGPGLRALASRHDVVPVWLQDVHEAILPNVGIVALRDFESGESLLLDTASKAARQRYAAMREAADERVTRLFNGLGLDHAKVLMNEDWPRLLGNLLLARARRQRRQSA